MLGSENLPSPLCQRPARAGQPTSSCRPAVEKSPKSPAVASGERRPPAAPGTSSLYILYSANPIPNQLPNLPATFDLIFVSLVKIQYST